MTFPEKKHTDLRRTRNDASDSSPTLATDVPNDAACVHNALRVLPNTVPRGYYNGAGKRIAASG